MVDHILLNTQVWLPQQYMGFVPGVHYQYSASGHTKPLQSVQTGVLGGPACSKHTTGTAYC